MIRAVFLLLVIFVLFIGCKHSPMEPVAGKGGNASFMIFTAHHNSLIDDATVYLKYNATSIPSNALFGDSVKSVNANAFDDSLVVVKTSSDTAYAIFTQLKPGKYYLFGFGFDPHIGEDVYGGIPFIVTEEKLYKLNCPVSEDH